MTATETVDRIKAGARTLGFSAVGVASAERASEGDRLREWLAQGHQAGMAWMNNPEVREDPAALLAGARSVVVVGYNYYSRAMAPGPAEGRVARYALGPDYHRMLRKKLVRLLRMIQAVTPCRGRVAVDAHPLLERAFAQRGGLGWTGKHACLIAPGWSSWLLLGELILDLPLPTDAPVANRCGTCSRCLASCPTGAITAPGVIDSNRCIAYLTIEHKGSIDPALRPLIGHWLFGCDLCQEACPWDRFAVAQPGFATRLASVLPSIEFLTLDDAGFRARFAGTALMRAGRDRMARNAAVVLGNTRPPEGRAALAAALGDASPLVRGHVAWALGRYGAREPLLARRAVEDDPAVLVELEEALASIDPARSPVAC